GRARHRRHVVVFEHARQQTTVLAGTDYRSHAAIPANTAQVAAIHFQGKRQPIVPDAEDKRPAAVTSEQAGPVLPLIADRRRDPSHEPVNDERRKTAIPLQRLKPPHPAAPWTR